MRAAVDTEIAVTSEGEIICKKQRDMPIQKPLTFKLRVVPLGVDEDGEAVTGAVVDASDPIKKSRKPLSGKNEVAMQALMAALRTNGTKRKGDCYPTNRNVVHLDHWRKACDDHGLTSGDGDSSLRMAFKRAKDRLMDINEVREWGHYVWRVYEDD
ncbi:MAG: hypothetical protein DI498_13290 [Paracoccus denitrificans]|nr:MAG: hypothetical protein DI498_13290 [Paracoccus denitrificans]PZO83060.1 MAG: hypothetical protein DI633_13290 [Paracoccus denitrificans]